LRLNTSKIEDVAQRCGFADASHFSRVFVQHTAMRPGEYRRTMN